MIGLKEGRPLVSTNFNYQWHPDGNKIVDEIIIDEDDDNDNDEENVLPPSPNMLVIDQDEQFEETVGELGAQDELRVLEEEIVGNEEVVQNELMMDNIIIDHNDNIAEEEAMENACHDLNADMPRDEVPSSTSEPTMINYRNKSGRSIRRHNYRTINGNDIQMDQITIMVTKENIGVLSKRLKKKFNKIKKDKIK